MKGIDVKMRRNVSADEVGWLNRSKSPRKLESRLNHTAHVCTAGRPRVFMECSNSIKNSSVRPKECAAPSTPFRSNPSLRFDLKIFIWLFLSFFLLKKERESLHFKLVIFPDVTFFVADISFSSYLLMHQSSHFFLLV